MSDNAVGSSKLRIATQVLGPGVEVVALYPELQTLDELHVQWQAVREGHRLETEVRSILYPTVTETAVAHRILERDARYTGLLTLHLPTLRHSGGLVHETTATLQLRTHVVEGIIAYGVVEVHIEREVLPTQFREDITIEVRIRVANDDTVLCINHLVVVLVHEDHVASTEIVLVNTIGIEDIATVVLGLIGGAIDTLGLVAIEEVGSLAHLGADGSTIYFGVVSSLTLSQLGNLVLVVTYRETYLPTPVARDECLALNGHVEARVLEFAAVAPVGLDAREETEALQGQEVLGLAAEEVSIHTDAVVEEHGLNADIEASRGLPSNLGVADVGKRETGNGGQIRTCRKETAGGIDIDTIVTTHVITYGEAQQIERFKRREP